MPFGTQVGRLWLMLMNAVQYARSMTRCTCPCAGAVGCFLLCIVLGACEAFTLYVLSKFSERYGARTYSGLVRRALGRKLSASEHAHACGLCM